MEVQSEGSEAGEVVRAAPCQGLCWELGLWVGKLTLHPCGPWEAIVSCMNGPASSVLPLPISTADGHVAFPPMAEYAFPSWGMMSTRGWD